ncbi:unnamed protein product [Spirodela intermedia]|uniref:Uncharacterized protein n=1 Tax=Spirodela intermedia TaxID=51605 RepID=A0A7I8JAC8_SPIIN|nr:unnamed protein product [Spirodela intermedia]CAA6667049.1 unnamed protein product [Spirodela intermedia]
MLKADPGNPLLLRNYGIFLHEVHTADSLDAVGAEDCYARAILGDPGDGELLSLYGNLIWEASGDEIRAERYLERAVEASLKTPLRYLCCRHVLGAYAHFLWTPRMEKRKRRLRSLRCHRPRAWWKRAEKGSYGCWYVYALCDGNGN